MGRTADGDIDAPPSPACLDGYGINAFALNCSRRGRWGRPIGGPALFEHARQTLVGACTAIPRNGVTSIRTLGGDFYVPRDRRAPDWSRSPRILAGDREELMTHILRVARTGSTGRVLCVELSSAPLLCQLIQAL